MNAQKSKVLRFEPRPKTRRAERNRRVAIVEKARWARERKARVSESIDFAADAKACRTHEGVTQQQMANEYGVTPSTICNWESGFSFGWTTEELVTWCRLVNKAAKKVNA